MRDVGDELLARFVDRAQACERPVQRAGDPLRLAVRFLVDIGGHVPGGHLVDRSHDRPERAEQDVYDHKDQDQKDRKA